jgi:hypothetical protein
MSVEVPALLERRSLENRVLVLNIGDLSHLDQPRVREFVAMTGLSFEEFVRLLTLDFEPIYGPTSPAPFVHDGTQIEDDVVFRRAESSVGTVEVAEITWLPAAAAERDSAGLHLKIGEHGGFEIIYIFEGSATLSFPARVEPAGMVYAARGPRTDIELTAGTLAIIPAPTANGWTHISPAPKARGRYLCNPPWSRANVQGVFDVT